MRRIASLAIAAGCLVPLLASAPASAQATRTWVSGVGDDVNPCSRTAPCKTFAGAISKTAAGGIINTLDPGGFGAVTITKSITISATRGGFAGVLASGGVNGINVAAGVNDKIVLNGLDIEGSSSNMASPGLNGVRVTQAGSVRIQDCDIYQFSNAGVSFVPTNNPSKLVISNSRIYDNYAGTGVGVQPSGSGLAKVTIKRTDIDNNTNGVAVNGASNLTNMTILRSQISNNSSLGVFATGGLALIRIGDNDILGNSNSLRALDAVSPTSGIYSWGDNHIGGNGNEPAPTGTINHT